MPRRKPAADPPLAPPPPCLAARGLLRAVHHGLPEGTTPVAVGGMGLGKLLWLIYGPQLRERFLRPASASPVQPAPSQPTGAGHD